MHSYQSTASFSFIKYDNPRITQGKKLNNYTNYSKASYYWNTQTTLDSSEVCFEPIDSPHKMHINYPTEHSNWKIMVNFTLNFPNPAS